MHRWQLLAGLAVGAGFAAWVACAHATPETRIGRMGERVRVGSLVYNVFEDHWKAKLGDGPTERIPKDRFFLVRLTVVNGGAADLMVPAMTLVDDSGETFPELSDGDQVPSWIGYLRQIKPAEALDGNVVFDVAPKHYRLRVADENGQQAREIDIPLTFSPDAPEMPLPGQP